MSRRFSFAWTALVRKDLRLRMRGWRWAGVTTLYVAVLAAVALAFLLQSYNPAPGTSTRIGIDFFQALSVFQIFLIVFVTPTSMAGAISGERQHRTLDLLLMSRLPAAGIVWAKFLSGVAFNLLLLATSVPIFALIFLFGGVGLAEVGHAFLIFVVTVVVLGALAVAVSTLTARLAVSLVLSLFISLLLAVGLSLLAVYLQQPGQPGILTLGNIPFQTVNPPSALPPLAEIDPLIAVLATLPADSGGTLLGDLGTVNHAFGLPWQLPLWGAYALVSAVVAAAALVVAARSVRSTGGLWLWRRTVAERGGNQ